MKGIPASFQYKKQTEFRTMRIFFMFLFLLILYIFQDLTKCLFHFSWTAIESASNINLNENGMKFET